MFSKVVVSSEIREKTRTMKSFFFFHFICVTRIATSALTAALPLERIIVSLTESSMLGSILSFLVIRLPGRGI